MCIRDRWTAARLQCRRLDAPAWYYRFLHRPPIPADADLVERDYAGAYHGADVAYVFGTLDAWPWDWTDADRALSRQMMGVWLDFARTGDPTASGDVDWPALGTDDQPVMVWSLDPGVGSEGPDPARMGFWDRYHGVADDLRR